MPEAKRLPSLSNFAFHPIAAWPDSFDAVLHPGAPLKLGVSAVSGCAPKRVEVYRNVEYQLPIAA